MSGERRPAPRRREPSKFQRVNRAGFGWDDLPTTLPGELTAEGEWVSHASPYDVVFMARPWPEHPRTLAALTVFGRDLELELGVRAASALVDPWALPNDLGAAHPYGDCACYAEVVQGSLL